MLPKCKDEKHEELSIGIPKGFGRVDSSMWFEV